MRWAVVMKGIPETELPVEKVADGVRENDAAPRPVSTSRPMIGYSAAQGKKASELLCNAAWVQVVHEELDGGVVAWQPAEGTVRMVLETDPFNVMEEGEKVVEYRVNTPYWRARQLQKDKTFRKFKEIEFSLGYQTNRRKFRARVDHMAYVHHVHESYSNGLKLHWPPKHNGYFAIWFTKIP